MTRRDIGTRIGVSESRSDLPTVALLMAATTNRDLLQQFLSDHYRVVESDDPGSVEDADIYLFDTATFRRHRDDIAATTWSAGVDAPSVMLLVAPDSPIRGSAAVWDTVADVVVKPVKRDELLARVDRLLREREQVGALVRREARLLQTSQVIEMVPIGIAVADAQAEDNPLVAVNDAFEELTGYDETDILGRNCRFLQGPDTDQQTRAEIRAAIDDERSVSVEILNYRADGSRFWNSLGIAPVYDEDGALVNFAGYQQDVTERRLREERLNVMNRVLRHNLRNEMNIVQGYAALLSERVDDPELAEFAEVISSRASALAGLGDDVRHIENAFQRASSATSSRPVAELVAEVVDDLGPQYPDVDLSMSSTLHEDVLVNEAAIMAVAEIVDNALKHDDSSDPAVTVDVGRDDDRPELVAVTVRDTGPGIEDYHRSALKEGETPLHHADRLGLWSVSWITQLLGGTFEISSANGGTTAVVTFPRMPNDGGDDGDGGDSNDEAGVDSDDDDDGTPDADSDDTDSASDSDDTDSASDSDDTDPASDSDDTSDAGSDDTRPNSDSADALADD